MQSICNGTIQRRHLCCLRVEQAKAIPFCSPTAVHTVLQDLLPSGAYFRFNPSITEDFLLDENRTEKIAQMQEEARDYLELNELKMEQVSGVLSREKTRLQKLLDWVQVQREVRRR